MVSTPQSNVFLVAISFSAPGVLAVAAPFRLSVASGRGAHPLIVNTTP